MRAAETEGGARKDLKGNARGGGGRQGVTEGTRKRRNEGRGEISKEVGKEGAQRVNCGKERP